MPCRKKFNFVRYRIFYITASCYGFTGSLENLQLKYYGLFNLITKGMDNFVTLQIAIEMSPLRSIAGHKLINAGCRHLSESFGHF